MKHGCSITGSQVEVQRQYVSIFELDRVSFEPILAVCIFSLVEADWKGLSDKIDGSDLFLHNQLQYEPFYKLSF